MTTEQIQQIEQQIGELTAQLSALRKASLAIAVPNYTFETNAGETTLLDLFGPHDNFLPFTTWVRVVATAHCGRTV